MERELELKSELTCPKCNHKKVETMPTDSCEWSYKCEECEKILRPIKDDCCVYCSYGTVPCPPIQLDPPKNKTTTVLN